MPRCIWCRQEKDGARFAVEHVIPEAIGCPNGFCLHDSVCTKCNNGLAHLDQAVVDEFDITAFLAGVPRKRGRPPTISSRSNLVGKYTQEGKSIFINMGNRPIRGFDGTRIGGYGKSKRGIRADLRIEKPFAKVSFSVTLGANPKFVRGIYKIGFSSLVYFLGPEVALLETYDPIREYVLRAHGKRNVLIKACSDQSYRNQVWAPYSASEDGYVVVLRLVYVELMVDLTPNMTAFPLILHEAKRTYGDRGWSYLPLELS